MDPNLFHVDWDRLAEALAAIIVLAFLLERALAVLFESRFFVDSRLDQVGGKELIACAVAVVICWVWQFDAISMIILTEKTTRFGEILTGAVIAGGSKASIKLFHDLLNIKSTAVRESQLKKTALTAAGAAAATGGAAAVRDDQGNVAVVNNLK
jgi:hypothetical protein